MGRGKRLAWVLGCLLGLLLVVSGSTQAQTPVSAEVNRDQLTTDERVTLTVNISGSADSAPILPTLQGLRIVSTGSSTQMSIVNGAVSAQAVYQYVLQPTAVGELTIDPITVYVGGQAYTTDAILLQVEEGIAPVPTDEGATIVPPTDLTGQDFYVEALVDNETPYLGEQILYIFRFYQAVELRGRPSYDEPDFVGFWHPPETQQTQSIAEVGGRRYRITELQTPIFPTIPGERTIESADFTLPDGIVLLTVPVTVDVQPLPEPLPDNFSGATGRYTLRATIDTDRVSVGDSITLRITLSGVGNIETLPEPDWPELDGWRQFENRSSLSTRFENGVMQGSRTYERLLIPSRGGTFTLPPQSYTFFNPETAQYETVQSDPLTLSVVGNNGADAADLAPTPASSARAASGLLPLKEAPDSLTLMRPVLPRRPLYWVFWTLPLLLVVGDSIWRWQRQMREGRLVRAQQSNAVRTAREAIVAARKNVRAVTAAERILTSYLTTRYAQPFTGLTHDGRAEQLQLLNIQPDLIARINAIYERSEQIRFTLRREDELPDLLTEVEQVIVDLEQERA
jgi:hypothetical protein